ncbi:MAG TPA: DUF2851 family protein [Puia sp.]|jgi:hypothetical protein|nr:DUF2851 family protein [Puia sp.]
MREEVLHFIWRYRHFHQQGLVTEDGRPLQIEFPGEPNTDQGPDLRKARIRIGDVRFEGPVELHVRASDWLRHGHAGDPRYQQVILHVVWDNDRDRAAGDIPVLVLATRVSKILLSRYEHWMRQPVFVPCERQLPNVDAGIRGEWIRALVLRRLQRRAALVRERLEQSRQDWEETTWWMLARSMGLPVNAAVFEAVARSLPLRLLRRHRCYPSTVETLLLGQAGLLAGEGAVREYLFWQGKYGLNPVREPVSFLRMRPGHFPAVRLSQLAGLLTSGGGWFSLIRDADAAEPVMKALGGIKGLGRDMQRGILINAFVPLLFTYGQGEKALHWLGQLPAERNGLLRGWAGLGVQAGNAADSQGLLELRKEYCDARRCLDCAIGRACLNG